MNSRLHQRLRAARLFANKKQTDIAKACKVSPTAVHLWESEDSDKRTVPGHKHIEQFAETTGAPIDWLLDDSVSVANQWLWNDENPQKPDPSKPLPAAASPIARQSPDGELKKSVRYAIPRLSLFRDSGKSFALERQPSCALPELENAREYWIVDPGINAAIGMPVLIETDAGHSVVAKLEMKNGKLLYSSNGDLFDVNDAHLIGVIVAKTQTFI